MEGDLKMERKNPKRLIRIALILGVLFAVGHLAGLREMTCVLSGTMPAMQSELFLGVLYVLLWFGAVLVAPIFAFAGALQLGVVEVAAHVNSPIDSSVLAAGKKIGQEKVEAPV